MLLYDVLGAVFLAGDVPTTLPTVGGDNLTVVRTDSSSSISVFDTFGRATNGIVHIFDIALAPTASIAELVSFRDI